MAKQWSVMVFAVLVFTVSEDTEAEELQADDRGRSPAPQLGRITGLPEVRAVELLTTVYALRADLEARRQVLKNKTVGTCMNPAELVLAIAVPGETRYVARKVQLRQEKQLASAYHHEELRARQETRAAGTHRGY